MEGTNKMTGETRVTRQVTSGNPALESARINGALGMLQPQGIHSGGAGPVGALPDGKVAATQEGEILSRRLLVSRAHFGQGKPPAGVARELGISSYLVRKTIQDIRKEARETYLGSAQDELKETLEQLDVTFARYNEAWERSVAIADREEFVEEAVAGDVVDGKRQMMITRSQRRKTPREYSIKTLEGMLRCIDTRARLLGLYEKKVEEVPECLPRPRTHSEDMKLMGEIIMRTLEQAKADGIEGFTHLSLPTRTNGGVSSDNTPLKTRSLATVPLTVLSPVKVCRFRGLPLR